MWTFKYPDHGGRGFSKYLLHIHDSQLISDHLETGGNKVSAGDLLGKF
jgi:hypothetical protein